VYLGATASVFDGATPVQTVPGPTTTVTVNPSAPAGSNPSPTGGQEDPAAREENLPGGKAAALTLDKHVASTPGCVYGGSTFGESSATIAHTYQRTALICNFYYGNYQSNQHPSLDYLVPTGATTFTASVGLDDSSVLTTATYRFDVIDVTSNNSLWSQDVRYGELVPVSVNVEGLLRIRLEVSMVAQGGGSGQAWVVWGDPRLL
ncbi:MAG: NPCBM/NEW2 domain-containing protein, partial [Micrococcales bacterium]|nr:NPCBM/NEW2 domain-containing protein [Micrococcales bacterium]